MQCSVLLYSLLYKYCCTAVWRPPPPQCSYCSRHRLSGRRSYLHPQFTAQLVGACSYWHLGTEHVFLWPCAYYYYFLRLKFLTTKFLTGDAVCIAWLHLQEGHFIFICFAPLHVHPCLCNVRISTEYLYSEHALKVRWMHSHPTAGKINPNHAPKSLCCCSTVQERLRSV